MSDTISKNEYAGNNKIEFMPRSILIPVGSKLSTAPIKIVHVTQHYEMTIGIGKDHIARLTINESALEALKKITPDSVIF